MPTLTYSGDTYVTPFDPAYVDLWGPVLNTLHTSHDNHIGRANAVGCIVSPADSIAYGIAPGIRFPCTVKSVELYTDAGTATAACKINGTNITSLSSVSVTTTHTSTSATGANTMVAGDDLTLVLSSVSGVSVLYYSFFIDRTGPGTA